jgi:hypothetical protein
MKLYTAACATLALLLLGGCDVTVNNKSLENEADAAAGHLENVAEDAGNVVGQAAEAVGNQVDALDNVNIDVNVARDDDTAETNTQ